MTGVSAFVAIVLIWCSTLVAVCYLITIEAHWGYPVGILFLLACVKMKWGEDNKDEEDERKN